MDTMPLIASPLDDAQSGDVWAYSYTDPIGRAVSAKTFSRITHVEIALVNANGGVELFSSRILTGVRFYPPILADLALVLRPTVPFRAGPAVAWAHSVVGQPYDLLGLLAFYNTRFQGQTDGSMFCSEACTRLLRHGGIDLFPGADADAVSPGMFAHHPFLSVVWRSGDEWQRWQSKKEGA